MRRLLSFTLIVLMLMVVSIPIATAAPPSPEDLTHLASYFPAETPLFAVIRTDEAVFDELNDLVSVVGTALPDLISPDADVRNAIKDLLGEGFINGVFPWMGNSAAIGAIDADVLVQSPSDLLVAVAVTDAEAALAYADTMMINEFADYTKSELGSYTLYQHKRSSPVHAMVGSDVFFYSTDLEMLRTIASGDFLRLNAQDGFTDAVTLLPAEGYSALVYVDTSTLLSTLPTETFGDEMQMMLEFYDVLAQADITQVFAATLLGTRTIALDYASNIGNYGAIEALFGDAELTLPNVADYPAVDLGFASYLPIDTQVVVQGTALGSQVIAGFDVVSLIGELFQQQMQDELAQSGFASMTLPTSDFGGMLQGPLTVLFAGFTGLNLEDDVLSWMTGDYALFFNLIAVETELQMSLDMGLVTEATDAAAALNVVDKIAASAERYGLVNRVETLGGGKALVLSQPIRLMLAAADVPVSDETLTNTPELDILIGANDDVLVVSSRRGAEFALDPSGETLADSGAFTYAAQNLFLPDSQAVAYIGFRALGRALVDTGLSTITPDVAEIAQVLSGFESVTASTLALSQTQSAGRFTFSFAAR